VRIPAAGLAVLLCAGSAAGQTVSMSGSLGSSKALLVIDGKPATVAVGSTAQGVRLISTGPQESVVEVGGKRVTLQIGAAQVNLGGGAISGNGGRGSRIVLSAGLGGHFMTQGTINGGAVQFMVDTGATVIAMGEADAARIGLKYRDGQRSIVSTANGNVAVYRVMLSSVRIGDVQMENIEAAVMPASMPHVLLGNSFLSRFEMTRKNDVMTLERRF
jgi:aspartyl protease family protein